MWEPYKKGFKAYLQLERSLSDHSVEAYLSDLGKLTAYLQSEGQLKNPSEIILEDLQKFIQWIAQLGMTPASQARIISGIRTFYKYCLIEDITSVDPTTLLEAPKLIRRRQAGNAGADHDDVAPLVAVERRRLDGRMFVHPA